MVRFRGAVFMLGERAWKCWKTLRLELDSAAGRLSALAKYLQHKKLRRLAAQFFWELGILDRVTDIFVNMEIFVRGLSGRTNVLQVPCGSTVHDLRCLIEATEGVPQALQLLAHEGKSLNCAQEFLADRGICRDSTIHLSLRLLGGIDFQNRAGSKPGSGGVASEQQAAIDRRERLRKLALETIDLNKDPYFMKNHLGSYECKLCLTLHNNEGNYLAHSQGKRHQTNLARRAAKEAAEAQIQPRTSKIQPRKTIKIGRPGYTVTKARDPETGARSLLFQIDYPEVESGLQPRHRFMSAYEQRVEAPDKNFQYLLFACEPYETIGFKIPNKEIDKGEGRFFTNWDQAGKSFTLQLYFKPEDESHSEAAPPPPRPKLRFL